MRRQTWILSLFLWLAWASAGWGEPQPGAGLGQALQARAVACLGSKPETVMLVPLNTPSVPNAIPASPGSDWRWKDEVLSPLQSDTPRVRVDLYGPKSQHYTFTMAFRKKTLSTFLVLRRPATRAQELAREQVQEIAQWTEASRANLGYLGQWPDRRMRTRRDLPSGSPLRIQDLEEVPEQEAGAALHLTSSQDGVTLTLPAVALESGYPGRAFRVRLSSGRTAYAWVWGPGDIHDSPPASPQASPQALEREPKR